MANPAVSKLRNMLDMTLARAGVGEAISRARGLRGWKQKQLAAAVHVEPMTVSRWERGVNTPDLEMLERIAEALGQPLTFFVTATPSERGELGEIRAALEQLQASVDALLARLENPGPREAGAARS